MSEDFDPYRKWLGIAPHEQPPHHYRLLGIAPFEDDPDVIENAADRQMAHVRTYQAGKYRDFSQKILNELAVAKLALLDPAKKAAYDEQLHQALFASSVEPEPEAVYEAPPPAAAPPQRREPAVPPAMAPRSVPIGQPAAMPQMAGPVVKVGSKSRSVSSRGRKKQSPVAMILLGLIAVGAVMVGLLVFLVMQQEEPPVAKKSPDTSKSSTKTGETPEPLPSSKKTKKPGKADSPERVISTDDIKPPPMIEVSREQKFQLALVEARDALVQRDLQKASAALVEAEHNQQSDEDKAEVQHLRDLHAHLDHFWKAVRAGIWERMQPGDVFEFRGEVVELIRREGEFVRFKFNEEEESLKITELKAPIAALFARKALPMRETKSLLCLAAFWTLDTKSSQRSMALERAKSLWVEAAERGAKDAAIARELGLDEAFINSIERKNDVDEPLVEKSMPKDGDNQPPSPDASSTMVKQPVPPMDALRLAKQAFAAKYGDDLAKARKVPADHETFLSRLEAEAPAEKDNALQYVMYEEACEAAAAVLRHDVLMKLAEEMAQRWEIDPLRSKQLWLLKARPVNSPATENFADTAAALAKEAHEAGRLDVAIAAANYSLRVGDKVKGRDQKELLRQVREWEQLADAKAKADAAEQALAKDNSDADAHLQLGRYLCYFQRDWAKGMPHLAQSSSEEEQAAAKEDLAQPSVALAKYAAAEKWYQVAKRKSGTARLSILDRAKFWYEQTQGELDDATRATVESRLREINKDLAPLVLGS